MIVDREIRLAVRADAVAIAEMSRDLIEVGLGWRWTPNRVLTSVVDRCTSVPVLHVGGRLRAFGIMRYGQEEAHLLLLAVHPGYRRRGAGRALMTWLETTALTAGVGLVYLEARSEAAGARAFYRALGYREVQTVRGYYRGREDCIRLGKDLWAEA